MNLAPFIKEDITSTDFQKHPQLLQHFVALDDHDIWFSIKNWAHSDDRILADLCSRLLDRDLFQISVSNENIDPEMISTIRNRIKGSYKISSDEDAGYYISSGSITNAAYIAEGKNIRILRKNGQLSDITEAADLPNIKAMSKIVRKYYLCWPKDISL